MGTDFYLNKNNEQRWRMGRIFAAAAAAGWLAGDKSQQEGRNVYIKEK